MEEQHRQPEARLGGVTFGHPAAFWIGVALVVGGVIAHLPR